MQTGIANQTASSQATQLEMAEHEYHLSILPGLLKELESL